MLWYVMSSVWFFLITTAHDIYIYTTSHFLTSGHHKTCLQGIRIWKHTSLSLKLSHPKSFFFLVHHPQFGEELLFGAKFPQATETIGPQISTNRDIFPEKCDASTQLRWIQPTMVRSMANWGYGRWNHTSTWSRNLRFRSEPQVKVIGSSGVGSHHLQQFDAICKEDINWSLKNSNKKKVCKIWSSFQVFKDPSGTFSN